MSGIDVIELGQWLQRSPVIAEVHPLLPLCLTGDIRIVDDPVLLLEEIDDVTQTSYGQVLILQSHPLLLSRFPQVVSRNLPPVEAINRNMRFRLDYARDHLLTTHKIADYLTHDVKAHDYDIVALLLIDGLSYGDVHTWSSDIQPCFVDGLSVTYRLTHNNKTQAVRDVGFPSIVNEPTIAARLYNMGFHEARGFTYWNPSDNVIAEAMFNGIPTRRTTNFNAICASLREASFSRKAYVQVVREGLDGLAHGKRELARTEIEGALVAIQQDIDQLITLLRSKSPNACLYFVADHGILWKTEHKWINLGIPGCKPRYAELRLESQVEESRFVRFQSKESPYYAFCYPYLGNPIPADDSGVHGGLSYQESIVPFGKIEV